MYRFFAGFSVPSDADECSSSAAAAVASVSPSSAVKMVCRGNDGGDRDEGETRSSTATGGIARGVSGSRAGAPRADGDVSASASASAFASAEETRSTRSTRSAVPSPVTRANASSAAMARAFARSNSAVAFFASSRNAAFAASPFSASAVSSFITFVAAATSSFAWRLTCSTASAFDRRAESRRISRSATRARQRGEDSSLVFNASLASRNAAASARRRRRCAATILARQNVTSASAAASAVAAVDGSIGIVTVASVDGTYGATASMTGDAAFATVRVTSSTASGVASSNASNQRRLREKKDE